MPDPSLSRREAIAALSASVASIALPGCATTSRPLRVSDPRDPQQIATALLGRFGQSLLRLGPEGATSLALDKDANADLRSKLSDRSAAGHAFA